MVRSSPKCPHSTTLKYHMAYMVYRVILCFLKGAESSLLLAFSTSSETPKLFTAHCPRGNKRVGVANSTAGRCGAWVFSHRPPPGLSKGLARDDPSVVN